MARRNNGRDGLLVDTWYWKYHGVDSELSRHLKGEEADPEGRDGELKQAEDRRAQLVREQVVKLELRLLKEVNSDDALPKVVNGVEFLLSCPELGIRLVGTDVEVLRLAAWSKLEAAHAIRWEPWYLVQIASANSYRGESEVGFALSQDTIYRGVARDGVVLMREFDRSRTFGPWRYKPWPGEYQDKGGHVIACIPATEENAKALNEFRARIRELQARLSELVKPAVILQTLANLSSIGLPAPSRATRLRSDDEDLDG